MNIIEVKLRAYLDAVNRGEADMAPHIIEEATSAFRRSLKRQFTPRQKSDFTLRMSNLGRPTCQLWYEKKGETREAEPYSHPIKMAMGDAAEAIAIAVLKAAGVNITATNQRVSLIVDTPHSVEEIYGTTDLSIDEGDGEKIWDVKSASGYSFRNKFDGPFAFKYLKEHDDFGYISQGIGYQEAAQKPFAGWIAVNKESGEIALTEIPQSEVTSQRDATLKDITDTVTELTQDKDFPGRCFEDEPETFRKKPTGNRILGQTCSYCPYKWTCWPGLKHAPQAASNSNSPKLVYYTHLEDKADG